MHVLRTPPERVHNLPQFEYTAHYLTVSAQDEPTELRMAYIDEGPRTAAPVLLLHGEPSWSFLYRKMIPVLLAAGHRVVAPDLIGFGRSDKPAAIADYSYARHMDWLSSLVRQLDLQGITLFCQDWGGLLGLRLVAEHAARFDRVAASNTFLPTGDMPATPAFLKWREFATTSPDFNIGKVISKGVARPMDDAALAAYNAPFPDDRYQAGARAFPALVPTSPDDPASSANRAAWEVLMQWRKPFLTAFGDSDPITRGADMLLQGMIPGASGQPHVTSERTGHFCQEDNGEWLAQIVNDFAARTR